MQIDMRNSGILLAALAMKDAITNVSTTIFVLIIVLANRA
jgi:hypothetical protein